MTDANLTKLFVRGCTWVIRKKTFALKGYTNAACRIFSWLSGEGTIALSFACHVQSELFAMKRCTNPARQNFPWLA